MTKSKICQGNVDQVLAKAFFVQQLNNPSQPIGQRLFILNIYLENLENFGKKNHKTIPIFEKKLPNANHYSYIGFEIAQSAKEECLEFFAAWSQKLKEELK